MSANADKFQAIFARKDKKSTAGISLMIDSEEIKSEDQVKLVGVILITNYHTTSISRPA